MTDIEIALERVLHAWSRCAEPSAPRAVELVELESQAIRAGNHGLRLLSAPSGEQARWVLRACAVLGLGLSERALPEVLAAMAGWSPMQARVAIARYSQELSGLGLVEGPDHHPELSASAITVLVGGTPGAGRPIMGAANAGANNAGATVAAGSSGPAALRSELAALLADLPREPGSVVLLGGAIDQAAELVAARAAADVRPALLLGVSPADPAVVPWAWWAWCWGADLLFQVSECPFERPWEGAARLGELTSAGRSGRRADAHPGAGARFAVVGPRGALEVAPPSLPSVRLPRCDAESALTEPSLEDLDGGIVSWPTLTFAELLHDDEVLAALDQAAERARRGERQVLLLHGPPGTGKSLSAQAIAGSLGRPLVDLDPGAVRGPIYGTEERAIHAIFRTAERLGAVVRLDEADDWLGRRSEAGHHRIAAAATTNLLRVLEGFTGVAVLTTNRLHAIDPAVHRRVDRVVAVDLPSALTRLSLWGRYLPERLHDPQTLAILASLPLAGGDIVATLRELDPEGTPAALVRAARRRAEQRRLLGLC